MSSESSAAIACNGWCILEMSDGSFHSGQNQTTRFQMASLTKMMTFLVVLRFCKRNSIDIEQTLLEVSAVAAEIKGTSANLAANEILSVEDLLYSMMLPSGNDAALCLAESFGAIFYLISKGGISLNRVLSSNPFSVMNQVTAARNCAVQSFVSEMNATAASIGLKQTNFTNPHGLCDKGNVSSALDMARLSRSLLKEDPLALSISSTIRHSFQTRERPSGSNSAKNVPRVNVRTIELENTNQLLYKEGFCGLKTGHTTAAGGCLSSYYRNYLKEFSAKVDLIIVVLGSESTQSRFDDTLLVLDSYFELFRERKRERCAYYANSIKSLSNS